MADNKNTAIFGNSLSFAANEAYKKLKINIQYSFSDGKESHVIAFTSAMQGDGKSLTALNTAISLSQDGYKTVLIDCDMRRPSVHEKLVVEQTPGLSEVLTGLTGDSPFIRKIDGFSLNIITGGKVSPNPIELLNSQRFDKFIAELRNHYKYIVLDLPPVGLVADALVTLKCTDGVVLVCRNDYTDKRSLTDAVRQLRRMNANILGVAYNGGDVSDKYYKKGYYGKNSYYGNKAE